MRLPPELYEQVMAFYSPFAIGRLDGGVELMDRSCTEWCTFDERQRTARALRELARGVGSVHLRPVCRSWRSAADENLRATHERLFGVRPATVETVLLELSTRTAAEEGSWNGPFDGGDPKAEEGWWRAVREEGTGDLQFSLVHRAATLRLHACLAMRSTLCHASIYRLYSCLEHVRETFAETGFLATAAQLPWVLDAHHIYINRDRITSRDYEEAEERDRDHGRLLFDPRCDEVATLRSFARSLLSGTISRTQPEGPVNRGAAASTPGETERLDVFGAPNRFHHRYSEPRGSALLLQEHEDRDYMYDDYCVCCEPPQETLDGACVFSFRPEGHDTCTPPQWGYGFQGETCCGGDLQRRGGRAWRTADLVTPDGPVVLDKVYFEHETADYSPCEVCYEARPDDAPYAYYPSAQNATVHLVFRILQIGPDGRVAAERERERFDSDEHELPSGAPRLKLVMTGTVRGLSSLPEPPKPPFYYYDTDQEFQRKIDSLKADLPPCTSSDCMLASWYSNSPHYQESDSPFWAEPQCTCARCRIDTACGNDKKSHVDYMDHHGDGRCKARMKRACSALRSQLPLYTHGEPNAVH